MITRLKRLYQSIRWWIVGRKHMRYAMAEDLWIATAMAKSVGVYFEIDRCFASREEAEAWGNRADRHVVMPLDEFISEHLSRHRALMRKGVAYGEK